MHIDFVHYTSEQASTQLNMMIASGDFYDLMQEVWYPGGPQAGIDEGCFTDLSKYIEYMPNFEAAIDCTDDSLTGWQWSEEELELYQPQIEKDSFRNCLTTSDGSIWCVSRIWDYQLPADAGPIIRQDWLDGAGLEMPDTLDELETVMEAFKQMGVTPLEIRAADIALAHMAPAKSTAHTTLNGYFTLEADKKTIGEHMYVDSNFKDYLLLMNKWYEGGVYRSRLYEQGLGFHSIHAAE